METTDINWMRIHLRVRYFDVQQVQVVPNWTQIDCYSIKYNKSLDRPLVQVEATSKALQAEQQPFYNLWERTGPWHTTIVRKALTIHSHISQNLQHGSNLWPTGPSFSIPAWAASAYIRGSYGSHSTVSNKLKDTEETEDQSNTMKLIL